MKKEGRIYPLIPSKINLLQDSCFYISHLTQYLTSESDAVNVPDLTPGLDSRAPEQQAAVRFCEHGNEPSNLLHEEEFLD